MFESDTGDGRPGLRIDLIAARELCALTPGNARYSHAAASGAFVVSVLRGDILEGVYTPLREEVFDSYAAAQAAVGRLAAGRSDAVIFDFVARPPAGAQRSGEVAGAG